MNKQEIDFTEGNIRGKIIKFVLPIIGAYLIQQAYNSADLIFSGNMLGKNYSAAIGASSLLVVLAIGLFGGLSVGTGILFARAFGAHDIPARRRIGRTVLMVSILVGSGLTLAGIIFARPALILLQTPNEVLDLAVEYIRIYFLSIIPMMIFNMTSGMLRAVGNSRIPMIFQTISGGLNIYLDWLFIKTMNDGIFAVAMATFISQALAAAMTYAYFEITEKKHYEFHLRAGNAETSGHVSEDIVPSTSKGIIKLIFSIGMPIGIQNMIVTLSNLFIQANINTLGVDPMATFADYFKIELFMYYPIVAFGQAALFIVSQNVGAGNYDRIRPTVRKCITTALPIVAAICAAVIIFAGPLFRFFNPEAEVIRLGKELIYITAPFYCLYVILETLSNCVRSMGRSKTSMFISLANFAVARALLLILFAALGLLSVRTVGMIYPITWTTSVICYYVAWWMVRDKRPDKC